MNPPSATLTPSWLQDASQYDDSKAATPEQTLLNAFMSARMRHRGPLLVMNEQMMLANTMASELLDAADRLHFWRLAQRNGSEDLRQSGPGDPSKGITVDLRNGMTATLVARDLWLRETVVGVLFRLWIVKPLKSRPEPNACLGVPAILGHWDDLTDQERSIVELVAAGRTNREAGLRLNLSRHTVDAHLRAIFRKFGIASRVDLARMYGEHQQAIETVARPRHAEEVSWSSSWADAG